MPVVLTAEEIAIETYSSFLYYKELKEMFLSPVLSQRFFEDERVLGDNLNSIKEFWDQLPEKYKKAILLREEINKLNQEKASELIFSVVERIGNGDYRKATERERIAIYKAFRNPFLFKKELTSLFLLSLKKGEDVLEKIGIKEKMSIIACYNALSDKDNNNADLSPTEAVSLLFFTNLEWFEPSYSYPLFFAMTRYFNDKDKYPEEILTDEGELFWEKIGNFIGKVKEDAETSIVSFSIGIETPTPFDLYSLARGGVVKAELPYIGKAYLSDLFPITTKRKWGKAYSLVEKAKKLVKNKSHSPAP